jgi:Ni,Fe-hydrogenase I cytochrome b subunit
MNPTAKAILRVVAVMVGTAYFLSTFYLVSSVPELATTQMAIGWYGTALGQLAIAMILVGIGLGVVSLRFGKEN